MPISPRLIRFLLTRFLFGLVLVSRECRLKFFDCRHRVQSFCSKERERERLVERLKEIFGLGVAVVRLMDVVPFARIVNLR